MEFLELKQGEGFKKYGLYYSGSYSVWPFDQGSYKPLNMLLHEILSLEFLYICIYLIDLLLLKVLKDKEAHTVKNFKLWNINGWSGIIGFKLCSLFENSLYFLVALLCRKLPDAGMFILWYHLKIFYFRKYVSDYVRLSTIIF